MEHSQKAPGMVRIPSAWQTEDGDLVVYGTLNTLQQARLTAVHLADSGFLPGTDEWPLLATNPEWWGERGKVAWMSPLEEDEGENPLDTKKDWAEGLVPVVILAAIDAHFDAYFDYDYDPTTGLAEVNKPHEPTAEEVPDATNLFPTTPAQYQIVQVASKDLWEDDRLLPFVVQRFITGGINDWSPVYGTLTLADAEKYIADHQ